MICIVQRIDVTPHISKARPPKEVQENVQYYEGRCGTSFIRAQSWATLREWAQKHLLPEAVAVVDGD